MKVPVVFDSSIEKTHKRIRLFLFNRKFLSAKNQRMTTERMITIVREKKLKNKVQYHCALYKIPDGTRDFPFLERIVLTIQSGVMH